MPKYQFHTTSCHESVHSMQSTPAHSRRPLFVTIAHTPNVSKRETYLNQLVFASFFLLVVSHSASKSTFEFGRRSAPNAECIVPLSDLCVQTSDLTVMHCLNSSIGVLLALIVLLFFGTRVILLFLFSYFSTKYCTGLVDALYPDRETIELQVPVRALVSCAVLLL
jgi:hypothetical protein